MPPLETIPCRDERQEFLNEIPAKFAEMIHKIKYSLADDNKAEEAKAFVPKQDKSRSNSISVASNSKLVSYENVLQSQAISIMKPRSSQEVGQNNKFIYEKVMHAVATKNSVLLGEIVKRFTFQKKTEEDFDDALGNGPVTIATIKRDAACLRLLVLFGFAVNRQNEFGDTALHYAISMNSGPCIDTLINSGADESILNQDGKGPWEMSGDVV
jgi:hypothetical protein